MRALDAGKVENYEGRESAEVLGGVMAGRAGDGTLEMAADGAGFVRARKTVSVNVSGALMVKFGPMLACVAGQGIALLLDIHARELLGHGKLVQVLPDWGDET